MVSSSSPYLDVTQDGNKVTLRLHSRVMNKEQSFTVGEEFDETQQDGAEMRVIYSLYSKLHEKLQSIRLE